MLFGGNGNNVYVARTNFGKSAKRRAVLCFESFQVSMELLTTNIQHTKQLQLLMSFERYW